MSEVQTMRRTLHQIPELDRHLPKTIAYIKHILRPLRCVISQPAESAVAAYFDFGKEKTLGFRSDMDALPIQEKNTVTYASLHAKQMHACGHDAHMAMLLAFALRLHTMKSCSYNVLLLFQPAEETGGGALSIIESGILDRYHVCALFAFHVWPSLKKGTVASKPQIMMAKSSEVDLIVEGKSAHIAKATQGHDALQAAVLWLREIQNIEANIPSDAYVLKFGYLQSGTIRNVISDRSVIQGSLRVLDINLFQTICDHINQCAHHVEQVSGCQCHASFSKGYPALVNDSILYERCQRILPNLHILSKPNMLSEDFAYYGSVVPSVFFYLGLGECPSLHADTFDFDDSVLSVGVDTYERLLQIAV